MQRLRESVLRQIPVKISEFILDSKQELPHKKQIAIGARTTPIIEIFPPPPVTKPPLKAALKTEVYEDCLTVFDLAKVAHSWFSPKTTSYQRQRS